MTEYVRELTYDSARLINTQSNETVASFYIDDYDFDKMREACNKKWDDIENN